MHSYNFVKINRIKKSFFFYLKKIVTSQHFCKSSNFEKGPAISNLQLSPPFRILFFTLLKNKLLQLHMYLSLKLIFFESLNNRSSESEIKCLKTNFTDWNTRNSSLLQTSSPTSYVVMLSAAKTSQCCVIQIWAKLSHVNYLPSY